jgi:hypothetical protein
MVAPATLTRLAFDEAQEAQAIPMHNNDSMTNIQINHFFTFFIPYPSDMVSVFLGKCVLGSKNILQLYTAYIYKSRRLRKK